MDDTRKLIPPFPVFMPEPEVATPAEWEASRCKFRKGRFEFMGGQTIYVQGNNTEDGLEDNKRIVQPPMWGLGRDPYTNELEVDITEQ